MHYNISGTPSLILACSGTVIGALLASLFASSVPKAHTGVLIAAAAGMMAGCGLVLLEECVSRAGISQSVLSFVLGILGMMIVDFVCSRVLSPVSFHFSGLSGVKAVRVFILLLSLVIHSLGEGFSLGLSAAEGSATSAIVATSLAVHNIPETAALVFSFRAKGASYMASIILGILSSLPQSLVAFPSLKLFSNNARLIEYGMGISAGCMAYAVIADVYPEAVASVGRQRSLSTSLLAGSLVIVFDIYSHIHIR